MFTIQSSIKSSESLGIYYVVKESKLQCSAKTYCTQPASGWDRDLSYYYGTGSLDLCMCFVWSGTQASPWRKIRQHSARGRVQGLVSLIESLGRNTWIVHEDLQMRVR